MSQNESEQEFLKAYMAMVWPKPQTPEYRVYYDAVTGSVIAYSNETMDHPYIIVDRETWAAGRLDCLVNEGKLIPIKPVRGKLTPADTGQPCDPKDVTIISSPDRPHTNWNMRTYED